MTEILRTEKLTKTFGKHQVLRGIDVDVRQGETLAILGASGSGKSTFLRCLNFMEMPTSGRIFLEQKLIGEPASGDQIRYREAELVGVRSQVGMVFQQFNLFPHLTVLENVMLAPIHIRRLARSEARSIAEAQLERMGLAEKAGQYPARLSGGQQQRVAIARALAMEPKVMLFDEATSSLDPELVGEVLTAMRTLARDGMTMLVVTHELGFAYNVASRVLFLHEGLIHEQGKPEEVMRHPQQARTKEFLNAVTKFHMPL